MSIALLIATSFSIGFFVESIVGFGGGLIAYSILGFFMDLKQMVLAGLYIGTLSSGFIAFTDPKSFDKKIFKSVFLISLSGVVFGVLIFSYLSVKILSLIFAILLMFLAIRTMFFDKYIFPKFFKTKLLLIGGIAQGAFGVGGPFTVNALKNDFRHKSNLRTTMAVFFVFFNIVRFVQLVIEHQISFDFFSQIWWAVIPVFCTIKCGHFIHLKISESFFKKLIAIMTVFAALKFLTKSLF
jgi:uncharacterized membrane protein YfcA